MYFELKENKPHGTKDDPFSTYHIENREFPIVKDTTPNMMNPRLYTTSYNKP